MNKPLIWIAVFVLAGLGLSSVFTVTETEYAVRFQLGKIVRTDYQPGLHFKLPLVNNVRKFDRRILTLDTASERMLTSEQKFVNVDSFIKWQIVDVANFYTSTQGNELVALNRLEQIIRDSMRNQIAGRTLVEVVSEERVNIMLAIKDAANLATSSLPWVEV